MIIEPCQPPVVPSLQMEYPVSSDILCARQVQLRRPIILTLAGISVYFTV